MIERVSKFVIALGLFLSCYAYACEQEVLILDGRVIVCSTCGGTTVCN